MSTSHIKRFVLAFTCCVILGQQEDKTKKDKIEFCGLNSSHECYCVRRTQAVQNAYSEMCRLNSKSDKELRECLSHTPEHCNIVDQSAPADHDGDNQESGMSDRCTMMCKKHDCRCDDGPQCHIGHSLSDHESSAKKK